MATFYDRFVECAERWPANVAVEIQREGGVESYTYRQLRQMAESISSWIRGSGLERGARAAIVADNDPRWVATYLGIIAAGCIAVPLDTSLKSDQLASLLKDSGTSLLFFDSRHAEVAQESIAGMQIRLILMDPERANSASGNDGVQALPEIFEHAEHLDVIASAGEEIASLLYTSGTTADPKGVMLTHANLLGEVEAVFNWVDVGPSDALLGVLPMFHVLALMANLMLPLVKGARVCYLETLNTAQLLGALQARGITVFAVVPQFFYLIHERIFQEVAKRGVAAQKALRTLMWLNRALRRLGLNAGPLIFGKVHAVFGGKMRYLVTGGSRFDPTIAGDFYAMGIDILQAYGLTETTAAVFANSPRDNVIGSVGKAMKGVEAKIVDAVAQENGGPTAGEIALRGAVVMKGYWNRPDATAEVLRDGWFYTGDLGYLDAAGNLFLTGRKKEVIVLSNGKNIYPEEVEAHYLKSPVIKELAVIGIEGRPGEERDRLHAVIVPNFDFLRQRQIVNAKEVIRFDIEGLSQQLPSTKRIGSYEIWQQDLPRTTTRKIKRFEIERRVKNSTSRGPADDFSAEKSLGNGTLNTEDSAWLDRPEVKKAMAAIREGVTKAPAELRPSHNLELDLGLDSMQRIELLSHLEQRLGGNLKESQLASIYTVRELVDAVLHSAAQGDSQPKSVFAGWKAVFSQPPAPASIIALTNSQPVSGTFWYVVSRLIQMVARDRFDLHVSGVDRLPNGACIICPNHQSYLDAPIVASILPGPMFKKVFAVATSEIFHGQLMLRLARSLRVVVVDPDANLVPAMRAGAFGLRQGRSLILFPEGERSIDGVPKTFKKGAAILSIHLQVPMVPVAIDGFYDVWPRNQRFRGFKPLRIEIGDPIFPPPETDASEEAYANLTAELKDRVVAMWKQLRERAPAPADYDE